MNHLLRTAEKYRRIGIIGMAKNTGKTTTLNFLLDRFSEKPVGIVSLGRDGEQTDLVSCSPKPQITVLPGTVITTTKSLIPFAKAKLEALDVTPFQSALGNIVVCRVLTSGSVQIAGPAHQKDLVLLCNLLEEYQVSPILIDGAIDRRAGASPEASEACILATGAALSRDIIKVAEQTAHFYNCLCLPEIREPGLLACAEQNKSALMRKDGTILVLETGAGLSGDMQWQEQVDSRCTHLFLNGALTEGILKGLARQRWFEDITLVLANGIRIFVSPKQWSRFTNQGLKVNLIKSSPVLAVTVNPVAPAWFFDPKEFIRQVRSALPEEVCVMDVYNCHAPA